MSADASREQAALAAILGRRRASTDQTFAWLLAFQWAMAALIALVLTTAGESRPVVLAVIGGGIITVPALVVARLFAGHVATRHAVALAQVAWGGMLYVVSDHRLDPDFLIVGSLALLAFYRDSFVLVTALAGTAVMHLWVGDTDPSSLVEHASWIVCIAAVHFVVNRSALAEARAVASREAQLQGVRSHVEQVVDERTRELARTAARYRALVENTAAIPFEYSVASDKVLYVAPQLANLLGPGARPRREFLRGMIHPDDHTAVREALLAFADSGEQTAIEYRLVRDGGHIVYVRTLLSDRSDDGALIRGITLDITTQRKLELELRNAQKLESVGRLSAGIAHEINTPIQFIQDSVEFARDATADLFTALSRHRDLAAALEADEDADLPYITEQLPLALDRAADGVKRIATIVSSLKAFAHPDKRSRTAIDLNAAIETTLQIARSEYKYVADIVLQLGDVPRIEGFAGEINQVILNLVVNAAHAIAEKVNGSESRGTIEIATARAGDHVEITIRDTGTGIPDSIAHRIFDPFFTTKPVGRGTGQGLALARSVVVDQHHGSLTFETEPGKSTTFRVRLPLPGHSTPTPIGAAA